MRFAHRRHPRRVLPIEITPMIDVVFLLIIFFMVTAQFARLTRAELELPREPGERVQAVDEAGLIINITSDGRIVISEREHSLDELPALIAEQIRQAPSPADVKLLIRADRDADAAVLNRVIDLLKESGAGSARLATEVPR